MTWDNLQLSRFLCAVAPFGGPIGTSSILHDIAMINDKRLLSIHNSKPVMHIYSSSGRLINQFQVNYSGSIIAMGWTRKEKLVCVLEQGVVVLFDLDGASIQISLGEVLQSVADYFRLE